MGNTTKNLDSVFADCTEAELGFEVMFDDDDLIIDHIAGVDEAGVPFTGPDFDWSSLNEADETLEDKDDAEQRDGKTTPDKEGMEGVKAEKPEIGGEVGDGKEVSGKENSAESNAHDVTPGIKKAITDGDKQTTSLKEDSAEGPLEDDDPAEREGKVADTSVETEGADCADGKCDDPEATTAENEKSCKESSAPDVSDAGEDISISEAIIAKIKEKRAAKKEAEKELEDGTDEDDDNDVAEAKKSKKKDDKESVKESHVMELIIAKRQQVHEAKEQAINDELLEQVLDEMTEEELNADNVLEVATLAVSKLRAQCEAAAADTLTDHDDADQRDGKAPIDNKNVEGVKSEVIGDSIEGEAKSDEIKDKCDCGSREGKVNRDDKNVEGVGTKVVGAALESATDELLERVLDEMTDEELNSDNVLEVAKMAVSKLKAQLEASDTITDEDDAKQREAKAPVDNKNIEGVDTKVVGAALESDLNIDDLMSSDDELIDLVIDDDEKVVPDSVKEDSSVNEASEEAPAVAPEVDDEDIDMVKNTKVEDSEEVDLDYNYDDEELIDIVINDEDEDTEE